MGQSYRIRTELGVTKTINVELNQEFEFLEILSLKLQQEEIYTRTCSDYGVVVGRVTANNGFGIPNARISVFIPIESIDESNPIISSIYPYKSPTEINEDGYRYNLLPYEPSYSTHAATGTFPSSSDVLTGKTAVEIYDRYFKYTARTNESGDYMIMGVPLGEQTIVMDVDLSDIGEFSLTPQDLIRMGLATEAQVAGNRFRTSTDLDTLPQIINLRKVIDISPLWGEPSLCQIAVNRVDFDLREEANVDIQPTAVFMGSMYSTTDDFRIRPGFNIGPVNIDGNRPRDNFGNLCSLQTGPGSILAIRQSINIDASGNPILEQYVLEQNGNVIDGDGNWMVELPMNLDYFVTNEFGERIVSYDPTIGIPTKSKYRFKIKWQQADSVTESVRRPYFLIPNIREFGWTSTASDPVVTTSGNKVQLASSYYFGLDWSGYTQGFNQTDANTKVTEIINCEDTFYEFTYNRVYTVSALIDQFKNGERGRFVGIKEIDDNSCADNVNKFPVNEGFRNFDFLFFIVSLLLQILQLISVPLLVVIHFVAFFLKVLVGLKNLLLSFFGAYLAYHTYKAYQGLRCWIQNSIKQKKERKNLEKLTQLAGNALAAAVNASANVPPLPAIANYFQQQAQSYSTQAVESALRIAEYRQAAAECREDFFRELGLAAKNLGFMIAIRRLFRDYGNQKIKAISLPALTYPDCQGCDCSSTDVSGGDQLTSSLSSLLSRFSDPYQYYEKMTTNTYVQQTFGPDDNIDAASLGLIQAVGGTTEDPFNPLFYKTPESTEIPIFKNNGEFAVEFYSYSNFLPLGERVNIFNTRKKYFEGVNKIKVTFDYTGNTNFHYDNTLTLFFETPLPVGSLLTFVSPDRTTDKNFLYSGGTNGGGIAGQALNPIGSVYRVGFCDPNNPYSNQERDYNLGYGSITTGYTFPADIEYYQVVTALTVNQAIRLFAPTYQTESLPSIVNSTTTILWNNRSVITIPILGIQFQGGWGNIQGSFTVPYSEIFDRFGEQYIVILQRGVDPYSPVYENKYGLGKLFGYTDEDAITITVPLRLNIPIQKLNQSANMQVQPFTVNGQSEIFYPSHFFRGGIPNSIVVGEQWSAFTTPNVGYYSAMDASYRPTSFTQNVNLGANYQNAVVSDSSNAAYSTIPSNGKYNSAKDLSGAAIFYIEDGNRPANTRVEYWTKVLLPSFTGNPMNITSNVRNVMRTDRLPSSDSLDGGGWDLNPALLQQNLGFAIYELSPVGQDDLTFNAYGTGADIVIAQIQGGFSYTNVLETLTECDKIVSLSCYEGTGTSFRVKQDCEKRDSVVRGCYRFVQKPLTDIRKDIVNFNEWAYRYRFFYGLCRGVLSQTFTNNWVNGSLFVFPIQVNITYDSQNKAKAPIYPSRLTYFDSQSNNFYFRSSPFIRGNSPTEFIGRPANPIFPQYSMNQRNLLFPTTIMNLGMKDSFFDEIIFEPSTNAYVMNSLNPTSYSDTSDLINLFVLSRITNANFLQRMLNARDYSINSLFTRIPSTSLAFQPKNRVDADLVQMLSINSEVGVVPFSTEYYPFYETDPDNSVVVLTNNTQFPTMGVFFSSSTQDLQVKDFLTPGIINFRFNPNASAVTYPYGIKSQKVPFYKWGLKPSDTPAITNIFGSERNDWKTSLGDIVTGYYQSLNRRNTATPNYFVPSITSYDVNQRGYIFNNNLNGSYNFNIFPGMKTDFLVGAPYHFYFGVNKGKTCLDLFKQKYLPNE